MNICKTIKEYFDLRCVVRCYHLKNMNCENCGNDFLMGLPMQCAYKNDFKQISHVDEKEIYCFMWCPKEKYDENGKLIERIIEE